MAVVRELVAKFGIDFDDQGLKEADKGLVSLKNVALAAGAAVAAIGVAGAFALKSAVDEVTALGDGIGKTAAKLGIGVEVLQELRFAGEQTGVAANTMDMAFQRFTRRLAEARKGTGVLVKELKTLNISRRDTPIEAFLNMADAIQALDDPAERIRLSFAAFDSEGVALVNTMSQGREGIINLAQEFRDTGAVMDAELIANTEKYNDALNVLDKSFLGVKIAIVEAVLPALTDFGKEAVVVIQRSREWITVAENQETVLLALKGVVSFLAITGIPLLTVALGALAKAAFLAVLPFAPIILLLTAIAAIIAIVALNWDDFVFVFKEGVKAAKAVLEVFAKAFGDLFESMFGADALDTVKSFFSGMLDAADKAFDRIVGGAKRVAKFLGFGGPVDDTGIGRGSVRGLANQSTQSVEPTGESLQSRIIEGAQSVSRVAEFMGVEASQSTPQNMSVSPPGAVNNSSVDNSDNRVNAEITINGAQSPERTGEAVANALAQSKKASNRRTRNQFRQVSPT